MPQHALGRCRHSSGAGPGEGRIGEDLFQEAAVRLWGVLGVGGGEGARLQGCGEGWLWAAPESKMVPKALISRGWRIF